MKRKIEIGTAVFLMMACTILACLITYTYLTSKMTTVFATSEKYSKLSQVDQIVASRYINEYHQDEALDGVISAYVASVDKYGKYMDANAYQLYRDRLNGKSAGLGVTVKYVSSTGYMKVVKVNKASSAYNVGVKPGDMIYKIDGKDVVSMSEAEASTLLNGKAGTSTVLSIYRGDETLEKEVLYSEYTTVTVSSKVLNGKIGWIRFESFDANTLKQFKKEFAALQNEGVTSLIFDLRNNDGGDIDSVCSVLDMILPKGTIVTTENKATGKSDPVVSDSSQISLPMCVLINGNTYGAAELFAADIRDFGKGKLIGETTAGKAVAQQIVPLGDQTAVYLSTQKFFPTSGKSFEDIGVKPDISVKMADADLENFYQLSESDDVQLQQAIKLF